jgi:hypothetical protein
VSLCIPSSSRSPDHDLHRTIYYLGYPLGRFAGLKHRHVLHGEVDSDDESEGEPGDMATVDSDDELEEEEGSTRLCRPSSSSAPAAPSFLSISGAAIFSAPLLTIREDPTTLPGRWALPTSERLRPPPALA